MKSSKGKRKKGQRQRTEEVVFRHLFYFFSKIGEMKMRYGERAKLAGKENPFALFEGKEKWKEATKALHIAIENFDETYKEIKKKYPDVGIGDTMTDEQIAAVLYGKIHFER